MMRALLSLLAVLTVACGDSDVAGIGPTPIADPIPSAPAVPTFNGTVTETLTGAPVHGFTADVRGTRVLLTAPGYVPRETRADAPTVDLIREDGFDLTFYRQFARGLLELGTSRPLRILREAPRIALQSSGLSASNIAVLEQAARQTVPALTGGRYELAAFDASDAPVERFGWIVASLVNDAAHPCGRALVGGNHIWLNVHDKCRYRGNAVDPGNFAHELGHALGFTHVSDAGALMSTSPPWGSVVISEKERRHAAIAYARSPGNSDIDVDAF